MIRGGAGMICQCRRGSAEVQHSFGDDTTRLVVSEMARNISSHRGGSQLAAGDFGPGDGGQGFESLRVDSIGQKSHVRITVQEVHAA